MSNKKSRTDFLVTILIVSLVITSIISIYSIFKSNNQESTHKISVVFVDSTDSKWEAFKTGLSEATINTNITLNVVTSGIIDSLEYEREIITEEINNGAEGIIFEPYTTEGLEDYIDELSEKTKVAVIGAGLDDIESFNDTIFIDINNKKVGQEIGEETIHALYAKNIKAYKVGIITDKPLLQATQVRLEALKSFMKNEGVEIAWVIENDSSIKAIQETSKSNVIIALDDASLQAAADYANNKDDIYVYGYGTSEKNLYHLNIGNIGFMIVPNGYNAAFTLIEEMEQSLINKKSLKDKIKLGTNIITQDNMFHEIYQQMLFPTTN